MSFGKRLLNSLRSLPRGVHLWQGMLLLSTGVPCAFASLTIERAAPGPASNFSAGGGSAEIRYAAPRLYAIVVEEPGKTRMLYGSGSVLTDFLEYRLYWYAVLKHKGVLVVWAC